VIDERKTRTEVRGGKVFRVVELPAVTPPPNRSAKSRYRLADVGKGGPSERPAKKR
jgi:hypothetical protein